MKLPAGHVAGQGVAKPKCTGGFGERMLRTMGWEAGQGLGKQGTGIKEAIQVKKKEDTVGVRRRRRRLLPPSLHPAAAFTCFLWKSIRRWAAMAATTGARSGGRRRLTPRCRRWETLTPRVLPTQTLVRFLCCSALRFPRPTSAWYAQHVA